MESKIDTLQTQSSGEEPLVKESQAVLVPLHQLHDSWRLLDANLIFQPLLSSLGVMPQQLKLTAMSENRKILINHTKSIAYSYIC